jgi:translocator protein
MLKNNVLALIDILLLIVTLVWLMVSIYTYYPWITYIQIPYLLWGLFAFVLQGEVVRRNWKK